VVDFDPTEYCSVIDQVPVDTWLAGKATCAQFTEDALASAVLVRVLVTPLFRAVNVQVPDVSVVPDTRPPAWRVPLPASQPANVTSAVAGKSAGSVSGCAVSPVPGKAVGTSVGSSSALWVGAAVTVEDADGDGVAEALADREDDGEGVGSSPPAEQPAARRLRTPTTANAAIGRGASCMLTGRPVDVDKGPGCINGNPKVKVEG